MIKDKIVKLFSFFVAKKYSPQTSFDDVSQSEKTKSSINFEYNVVHEFDAENNWIGYDYIERISTNHIRHQKYKNDGSLIAVKHIFENNSHNINMLSGDDFIVYMNNLKYKSHKNNIEYFGGSVLIDLKSNLKDAKFFVKNVK